MCASVRLPVDRLRLGNGTGARAVVPEVGLAGYDAAPVAAGDVDFMVPVRLRVIVHIVGGHRSQSPAWRSEGGLTSDGPGKSLPVVLGPSTFLFATRHRQEHQTEAVGVTSSGGFAVFCVMGRMKFRFDH